MNQWPLGKIVEIEWIDSCGTSRWVDTELAKRDSTPLGVCKTVGYLILEDKVSIRIAQSQDKTCDNLHNTISIPKVAVTKKRVLK